MRGYLKDHVGVFEPDEVVILLAAFDNAWGAVQASGVRYPADKLEFVRAILAKPPSSPAGVQTLLPLCSTGLPQRLLLGCSLLLLRCPLVLLRRPLLLRCSFVLRWSGLLRWLWAALVVSWPSVPSAAITAALAPRCFGYGKVRYGVGRQLRRPTPVAQSSNRLPRRTRTCIGIRRDW
jgi:hypothetical protein